MLMIIILVQTWDLHQRIFLIEPWPCTEKLFVVIDVSITIYVDCYGEYVIYITYIAWFVSNNDDKDVPSISRCDMTYHHL